jgi:hypothetical protein
MTGTFGSPPDLAGPAWPVPTMPARPICRRADLHVVRPCPRPRRDRRGQETDRGRTPRSTPATARLNPDPRRASPRRPSGHVPRTAPPGELPGRRRPALRTRRNRRGPALFVGEAGDDRPRVLVAPDTEHPWRWSEEGVVDQYGERLTVRRRLPLSMCLSSAMTARRAAGHAAAFACQRP